MVNINIEIPDDVHKSAKIEAIKAEMTLKEYIIKQIDTKLREVER